jgi:hypothetical protein
MSEIERLTGALKEMENECKEIESRIRIIKGKMTTMKDAIKKLDLELKLAKKQQKITVEFGERSEQK